MEYLIDGRRVVVNVSPEAIGKMLRDIKNHNSQKYQLNSNTKPVAKQVRQKVYLQEVAL